MFHGNKWGWRTLAARLLLAPVLAAGVAAPAAAQQAKPGSTPQQSARAAEPKDLLKMGREALKGGQFDRAQDLARQADAANPSGRWGLFDDTPESLEKDIRSARAKADKAESEKLTKAAKDLAAKPAKTAGEKLANLDQAYALADRAATLAGPGDYFDVFGDRPEKVKKDIDAVRAQVRKANPTAVANKPAAVANKPAGPALNRMPNPTGPVAQAGGAKPADGSKVTTAGATAPKLFATPPASKETLRTQAVKMVADGRMMMKAGELSAARAKATEAQKLGVTFAATEDSPENLLRDVTAEVRVRVDLLTKEADAKLAAKEYAKAEAALTAARFTSMEMGFPTKSIEEKLAAVRGAATAGTTVAAVVPEVPTQPITPAVPAVGAPVHPPVAAITPPAPPTAKSSDLPGLVTPTPVLPQAPTPGLSGTQMLAQAEAAMARGELEEATKLATQAHNQAGAKKDAQDMLRLIDAARTARQKSEMALALQNAAELHAAKRYEHALGVLKLIEPGELDEAQKKRHANLTDACMTDIAKVKGAVTTVAASDPQKPAAPASAGLADQQKALAQVEFQKFRTEGLDTEAKARDAFNKGETDLAIQMLTDFTTRVKASGLTASQQGILLGPVDRRLEGFRIMKRQIDFYTNEVKDKKNARDLVAGKALAEAQKHDELKKKTREVSDLVHNHKYREAEALALQLKALDPDDPGLSAIYEMAKRQRRADDAQKLKGEKELFNFVQLNNAERPGAIVDIDNPLSHNVERSLNAMKRGDGSDLYIRTKSAAEREIELKLDKPLSIEFSQTPIKDAIAKIRDQAGLNISIDTASIAEEALPIDTVTVDEHLKDLSLRNVLTLVLDKARLKYVVKNDVIQVTTEKKARGQLQIKVFSVMDLVTPIPDFALADYQSLGKAIAKATAAPGSIPGSGQPNVHTPQNGLQNGTMVSSPPWAGPTPGGGTLDNRATPLASSASLATTGRQNTSQQLMKLITGMVRPYSWSEMNGPGKLEYYDIGGALVVNQTADVIREVQDLLESLRRLQETSVAVEIRVISLSEAFFERVGIDFSMNVSTMNNNRKGFERSLTTGQFRPEPFINSIGNQNGVIVGYNPAGGGFTPDLNIPIRSTSYPLSAPQFGGYTDTLSPTLNGGLSVGLAFLNDIQVYMFMEAAQGDRRVNIMQAPKITLFNGQTSTVFVSDVAFFTLGLTVFNVGGQVVYAPTSVPIPIGTSPPLPGSGGTAPGVSVTVQAIVSSDRRFVRMNLTPDLTTLTSAIVPLFPVTAFITPVFEGGSQGVPIPFTQFFQQPSLSEISVQTTVAVPDGGTVVLGGLKTLSEGRNEYGPPVLSSIPYLNRLFRNQGIGRETRHIMIMVTPRIIIQSEEEFNQTGASGPVVGGIAGGS